MYTHKHPKKPRGPQHWTEGALKAKIQNDLTKPGKNGTKIFFFDCFKQDQATEAGETVARLLKEMFDEQGVNCDRISVNYERGSRTYAGPEIVVLKVSIPEEVRMGLRSAMEGMFYGIM